MSSPPAPAASPFISQNRLPPAHTPRGGGSQSSTQAAPPRHFSASSKMLLTRMRAEDEQPNLREATLPTFTSKLRKPNAPTAATSRGNVNSNNHRRANNRSNGSRSNTHHRLPSGPSPPVLQPAASPNSSPPIPTGPRGGRHPWNGREDSVLIASVQQHGQDWSKCQTDLQRIGAPPRACGAIAQRYFRLSRQAVRQQEIASAASPSASGARGTGSASTSAAASASSSSTPQQQQQLTLASLQTASSDLNKARSKQTMVPWTSEEDRILVLAAEAAKQHKEIWPLFCKSLPQTTRTASAVETRWNQFLRPEGRRKRNRSRSKTGDSGGNAGNGDQRQPGSVASTFSGTEPPQGPAAATPPPFQQVLAGKASEAASNEAAAAAATLASMTREAALAEAQQDVDAAFDSFEGADFAQDVNEDDAFLAPLQQANVAATTSPQAADDALIEASLNEQEDPVNFGEDAVAPALLGQSYEAATAEQAWPPRDAQAEASVHPQDDSAIDIEEPELLTPPLRQLDDPPAAGPDQPANQARGTTPIHPHDDYSIINAHEDAAGAASSQHLSNAATAPQEFEDGSMEATPHDPQDTTFTPTHRFGDDSHQIATLTSPPSASAPLPPLYDQATPALNYTIDYLPNGFLIRNFPPHHELHIHSPTSCQVIKPERAALPQLERVIQQQQREEQYQPYAAPFIFRAGSSGFIQALALPPGTERSVELVSLAGDDVEEEEGEEGGAGERGGNEGQARFIESRFDAPDGYCVRFESQLRG